MTPSSNPLCHRWKRERERRGREREERRGEKRQEEDGREGGEREGGGRGRREEERRGRKKMEERELREKIPFMVYELSVLTSTDFIPCETADSKALHADWDIDKHISY